ncbi:hypothetical protein ACFVZ4_11940 [Streptomyces goshikiensis]|uniref:hypothetical protein n=2 Tax=Streptomyces goshikiensis TaxID=1942 RepID=UPI003699F388
MERHDLMRLLAGDDAASQAALAALAAVELLRERREPIRIGQIKASGSSWVYTVLLTEDGGALVACAGVRRPGGGTAG